jgi:hypothetical protein
MNEVRVSQIPVDETGYDGDEEREARTEISATKRALKLVGAGTSRERQNPSTSMAGSSSDRNSDNQAFNSISDYVPRSPPRLMPFTDMVPSRPLPIGDPSLNGFNLSEELQTLAQIDAFEKDYLSKFTIWAPTLTQEVILAQIEGLRNRAYDTGERYVVKGSGLGYPAFHGMKGWTATARFMPRLVKGGKGSEVWKGSAIWWDGNGYVASSSEK